MKTDAIRLAKVRGLPREEWLALRQSGIGGSDAAAIVGLNPFKSRLEVYCDKKGILPEKDETEAMRQGRDLEEYVASRWSEATGKKMRRSGYMWRSRHNPFMLANIDREVEGENAILECKTTNRLNKSDFENGEIPLRYYVQCMHYLAALGVERAYLAVLVFGKGFYNYVIERDEKEIENLIAAEQSFWEDHLMADVPPLADGSDGSMLALDALYPEKSGSVDIEDYDVDVRRYIEINSLMRKLDAEKDEIKGRLASAIGEHERGVCSAGEVINRPIPRSNINTARMKRDYPEICEMYTEKSFINSIRIMERKNKND